MAERVVITGMGIVCPMGHDVETLWGGMLAGESGVAKNTIFDASTFPTTFDAEVKGYNLADHIATAELHKDCNRGSGFVLGATAQACRAAGIDIETDEEPAGPNPFFAMDTATRDPKHKTAKEQVEMVKELGYAGIGPQGGAGLPEMVKECRKNNLNLYAAYVGCDIGPDEKKYGPELTQAIEALKGTNSMLWLFVRSNKDKVSSPTGDDRAVAVIQEIADMAAKKQVRIALYPHVGFWVERVEDAVRVVKKVDRPNVGVTFNLCHWLKVDDEKNAKSLIKLAMPYLFVVSINGADSGGDNWKTLIQTLDKGTYDVGGFLKLLADNGYTGPIGFQGYDIGGDAYDNLKRTMDAWRKLSKVMN